MIKLKTENHWIYRYREYNVISIKELLYQEIYFSSQDELNDPLDYEFILRIEKNKAYIHNFFVAPAFDYFKSTESKKIKVINEISNFLSSMYISLNDIEEFIYSEYILSILFKYTKDKTITNNIQRTIVNTYRNLFPINLRSASFSKTCTNPLLWTHYSKAHTGFCVIFSPTKKILNLRNIVETRYAPFKCYDVKYGSDIDINLSLMFDSKNEFSWHNVYKEFLPEVQKKALLTKHISHSKEKEIRILGSYGTSYSTMPVPEKKILKSEKIYYFDPNQFVGIVFGYQMKKEHQDEIIYILDKSKKYSHYKIYESIKVNNTIVPILKHAK